eukprot:TRINITY_DN24546_c0_g1_i1.p1 TRINITY_DN24546_c0_g1~~TRINITY_DN24546_c0_g1_i1.p1  ORF type:complete len:672 (+),score=174.84 TRINITY_DN24546_c0_g1_i1:107-2017(+)
MAASPGQAASPGLGYAFLSAPLPVSPPSPEPLPAQRRIKTVGSRLYSPVVGDPRQRRRSTCAVLHDQSMDLNSWLKMDRDVPASSGVTGSQKALRAYFDERNFLLHKIDRRRLQWTCKVPRSQRLYWAMLRRALQRQQAAECMQDEDLGVYEDYSSGDDRFSPELTEPADGEPRPPPPLGSPHTMPRTPPPGSPAGAPQQPPRPRSAPAGRALGNVGPLDAWRLQGKERRQHMRQMRLSPPVCEDLAPRSALSSLSIECLRKEISNRSPQGASGRSPTHLRWEGCRPRVYRCGKQTAAAAAAAASLAVQAAAVTAPREEGAQGGGAAPRYAQEPQEFRSFRPAADAAGRSGFSGFQPISAGAAPQWRRTWKESSDGPPLQVRGVAGPRPVSPNSGFLSPTHASEGRRHFNFQDLRRRQKRSDARRRLYGRPVNDGVVGVTAEGYHVVMSGDGSLRVLGQPEGSGSTEDSCLQGAVSHGPPPPPGKAAPQAAARPARKGPPPRQAPPTPPAARMLGSVTSQVEKTTTTAERTEPDEEGGLPSAKITITVETTTTTTTTSALGGNSSEGAVLPSADSKRRTSQRQRLRGPPARAMRRSAPQQPSTRKPVRHQWLWPGGFGDPRMKQEVARTARGARFS